MDSQDPITPEALAAELASMLRTGITTKGLRRCPALLALPVVVAKAASDSDVDRAVATHGLLRELVVAVDGERDGPVASLLGLAPGGRGSLLKDRRQRTAELLYISPAHLRTSGREDALIEALADELSAADSAWRLRHRHRTTPEREPAASRLSVDWLDRHQAYRRVWTPIAALRDDLWVLLKFLREDRSPQDITDRLMTMTWRYAQFCTELQRFIADYGGLWLLADIDSEVAVADAMQHINVLQPFGEADDSWLRLLLHETPAGELEPFSDHVIAAGERGEEALRAWLTWAKACNCQLREPDPGTCAAHAWMDAADEFSRLVDSDWLAIADWYRLPVSRQDRDNALREAWRLR